MSNESKETPITDGCAWFTVKGFSVRIQATDEGVIADIYALGKEDEGCLAGTYAYDSDLIEEEGEDE